MTATATLQSRQFRRISSATTTRPNDTSAYTAGDLVANSVTAASVVPLSWVVTGDSPFFISRIRLQKSSTGMTNPSFRLHVFDSIPAITTTGDNGAIVADVTGVTKWLGSYAGTMATAFLDGSAVDCLPTQAIFARTYFGGPGTLYGLIEATAAYAPGAQEIFTATLYLEYPA